MCTNNMLLKLWKPILKYALNKYHVHWLYSFKHLKLPISIKIPVTIWQRTSDGGNGNHSVSLPIILIKVKVNQMLPFSYISLLLVSIL